MRIQRLLLGLFRILPTFLVRRLAGAPLEIDGNVLDPRIHLVANGAAGRETDFTDIPKFRAEVHQMMQVINAPRRKGVVSTDTMLDDLRVRIYNPPKNKVKNKKNIPAILFFHQGGLVVMDIDSDDTFCTIMASVCGAQVISLDYRLCPENDFFAPHEDALALWDYVQKNAADMGIDAARVAVAGDSAGGLLASVLCQRIKERGDGVQVKAQLLAYPWVSTNLRADENPTGSLASCADCFPLNRATMEFFNAKVFPNDENLTHAYANPLEQKDLQGLPPAVIATAGFDPIRDQGNDYAAALTAAGVSVTHYCFGSLSHSFLTMGQISDAAAEASEQLARDLAALL